MDQLSVDSRLRDFLVEFHATSSSSYLSGDVADESEGDLVGPGEVEELAPPPGDHLRHVEPGEEGNGDEAAEPPRVDAEQLEVLSGTLVMK